MLVRLSWPAPVLARWKRAVLPSAIVPPKVVLVPSEPTVRVDWAMVLMLLMVPLVPDRLAKDMLKPLSRRVGAPLMKPLLLVAPPIASGPALRAPPLLSTAMTGPVRRVAVVVLTCDSR